jgi:hypothetical protein
MIRRIRVMREFVVIMAVIAVLTHCQPRRYAVKPTEAMPAVQIP